MAASELNNRLDYLISYSSQLVFVCSDKIPQQSKVVESFIAHQNEHVDLALLTAYELTPLVIYREKLFRQLVSKSQTADFNRPLNQLLAPLNNHSGPILINIFKAEKLPIKLVKELWDLVLQSRFANNKQHLNVLLMGLSDWAETAKSSLGAKSKDQPILLNSQTEDLPIETDDFSDLESFIQDKRKKFAQRVESRQQSTYAPEPVQKKAWVFSLIFMLFLVIFAGILGWLYPNKLTAVINYLEQPFENPTLANITPVDIPLTKALSTIDQTPVTKAVNIDVSSTPHITQKESTKDPLVTDWATASAKLNKLSSDLRFKTNLNEPDTATETPEITETKVQPPITKPVMPIDTVNDYQVEDIRPLKLATEKPSEPVGKVEDNTSSPLLSPKPEVILALPDENFVIQIAAMANFNILQQFIRKQQLGQQLWLYKTQRYGADWYVLLKNQHFSSLQDARAEIRQLSDTMRDTSPFVKRISQVKQEISVSST